MSEYNVLDLDTRREFEELLAGCGPRAEPVSVEMFESDIDRDSCLREHRRTVNQLVWLEWYATGGDTAPGLFDSAATNWRLAAVHLEAFDIVRHEFGAPTRDSIPLEGAFTCSAETAPDERASELEGPWQAV